MSVKAPLPAIRAGKGAFTDKAQVTKRPLALTGIATHESQAARTASTAASTSAPRSWARAAYSAAAPAYNFRFGLARVLDGIEALIRTRS